MTSNKDTTAGSSSAALRLNLPESPERRQFLRGPDEALAAAAMQPGGIDALAELERRYHAYVTEQVTGYTPPGLLVDEVFAEMRALIAGFDYDEPGGFQLWLDMNCIDPVIRHRSAGAPGPQPGSSQGTSSPSSAPAE